MEQDILNKISELKKKRNAVILAHLYQPADILEIADFSGDSLDLSRKAADTSADVIVFCGVHFMAETASVLSPGKKVLLPASDAGCPMADMITVEKLKELKNLHPDAKVISYVNTSAAVKAESDICCTSSNAVSIVKSLKNYEIIFTPDRNLGAYASKAAGKTMILYDGFCPTHNNILPEAATAVKTEHPQAEILVHPECRPEVTTMADKVMSTSQMCGYVKASPAREFIIGTELGIMHTLTKQNPGKKFYALSTGAVCQNMKKITVAKVIDVLTNMSNEVKVQEPVRARAYAPLAAMLQAKLGG